MFKFKDRVYAGNKLAGKLLSEFSNADIVIGLARGGVVISRVIASVMGVPHDVLVVKKIGSPGNPELAIGALAPDGISYIDQGLVRSVGADQAYIRDQIHKLTDQITSKTQIYRRTKEPLAVDGKTIFLTDDGAATGATMQCAVLWARALGAQKVIIALPVTPPDVVTKLRTLADKVVTLATPRDFGAVGQFYLQFPQLTDKDVIELLWNSNGSPVKTHKWLEK